MTAGDKQRLGALFRLPGAGVGEAWYVAAGTGDLSAPVAYRLMPGARCGYLEARRIRCPVVMSF